MPIPLPHGTTAPQRVLVVDDDREVALTLELTLRAHGYVVTTASDGSEGLMRAERDAPHLILVDLMMPRRSGLSVVEHLHRWPARPRIILMTASTEARHRQLARDHGVDGFLSKPFEVAAMLAMVDGVLPPLGDRFARELKKLEPRRQEENAV